MNLCHLYEQYGRQTLNCKATDSKHLIHAMKNILLQENVSNIVEMKLNGCNITEISNETFNFSELDGIQNIDLSHNGLLQITSGLFYPKALDKLQKLNLDYNEISYLPSNQFIYLKKLKYLHISFNKIDQIGSDAFNNLKELDSITLSNDKITFLPNNLLRNKSLYKLTELDFSYNNISVIPNRFLRSRDIEGLKRIYFQNTVRSIESPTGCDVDGRWAGRGLADHNSSTARPASVQPTSSQCSAHVHPTGGHEATLDHA